MLVLSRRVSESIQIGEGVTVSVVRIEGDRVRLGVTAPSDVRILRSELLAAVADENVRAARAPEAGFPRELRMKAAPPTTPMSD